MNLSNLTIALDFDGTCVKHTYPHIGGSIGAEPVLRRLVDNGAKLILWTMRHGASLEAAQKWFADRDIPLYGVQTNPTQHFWTKSAKCYAKIYIDDAALGCPLVYPANYPECEERPYVDWVTVEKMLFPEGAP